MSFCSPQNYHHGPQSAVRNPFYLPPPNVIKLHPMHSSSGTASRFRFRSNPISAGDGTCSMSFVILPRSTTWMLAVAQLVMRMRPSSRASTPSNCPGPVANGVGEDSPVFHESTVSLPNGAMISARPSCPTRRSRICGVSRTFCAQLQFLQHRYLNDSRDSPASRRWDNRA